MDNLSLEELEKLKNYIDDKNDDDSHLEHLAKVATRFLSVMVGDMMKEKEEREKEREAARRGGRR